MARKKAAAPDTCRLTLTIRGVGYSIRPVPPDGKPPGAVKAYRLRKLEPDKQGDFEVHDVAETTYGNTCTCGDFEFRRHQVDPRGCKHIRALVAFAMISPQALEVYREREPDIPF